MIPNALKLVSGVLLGLAIVAGAAFAFTVTTSTLSLRLNSESLQTDAASTVTLTGITVAGSSVAPAGDAPGSAVEAAVANPSLNNAMTAGNLLYTFTVTEAAVASWNAATTYKVEVYGDNALLTTLYFKNAAADNANVEGVDVIVNLGSPTVIPDNYVVQVVKTS